MRLSNWRPIVLLLLLCLACSLGPPAAVPSPTPQGPTSPPPAPKPTPKPSPTPGEPAQPADIVFVGGHLITMDPDHPDAQAIAVLGDTILAVGSDQDIMAYAGSVTQIIDLHGQTVLPGFNDSHTHMLSDFEAAGYPSQEAAIQSALAFGYTSISDMFTSQPNLDRYLALDRAGQLPLRVNAYLPVNYGTDRFGDWYRAYTPSQEFSPYLRIAGVKVFVDSGGNGEKYMSQPYANQPGYYGDVYWTQDELDQVVADAHAAGYQIAAHTCGDAALDMIMNAYEAALAGENNEDYHLRVEHVMIMRDDQLQRMAELHLFASVQLDFFNSDWRDEMETTLGPQRVFWVGRWRDLLDDGVPVIGSTDAPYGYGKIGSPLKALYQAVTRVGDSGDPAADWMLAQTLTVDQAIDMLTLRGAYATFQDPIKGSLTAGKLADLIILSDDPLSIPPEQLLTTDVWLTMVGGQTRYCAPDRQAYCPAPLPSAN